MEQLSTQDLRAVLNCLETLQVLCPLQDFPAQVLRSLTPLIGSDVSFLSSFADGCNSLEVTPAEVQNVQIEPGYFQQTPLIQRYFRTLDCSAYKISDFLSEQEVYQRESLYDGHLRPWGLADQLAMVISDPSECDNAPNRIPRQYLTPTQTPIADVTTFGQLEIGFYRTSRSFSERDRTILNLIRPHIVQAYRNAQIYTQLQHQARQLSQAIDELGSVILAPSGRVLMISPRALQLLSQYFPDISWFGEQLPDPLQSWVTEQIQQPLPVRQPLRIERSGQSLRIRLLGNADAEQFLLVLEESDHQNLSAELLQPVGLTRRESEVLIQVAQGKTDAEIALVLDISKKTVNKHLENLFKKLNVNTRAAAVTKSLELLRLMEPPDRLA
jgi:DNA-binding CsgD family transcriptional regulator